MRGKLTVALLAGVAVLAGSAETTVEAANQAAERPAPVGHRQPTSQDVQGLPEAKGQPGDEQERKLEQELDRKLKGICKGC